MLVTHGKCYLCGDYSEFKIADDATLLREAKCCNCGASLRNSDLAKIISYKMCGNDGSLREVYSLLKGKKILNTCSSGYIHDALKEHKGYVCSEYFDSIESGDMKDGILCVDLCKIPFKDNSFDLVISEDVLEHVENIEKAFSEINRVLNLQGMHIFTVPVHEGRKTISRKEKANKIYHGDPIRNEGVLVWTDFGSDISEVIDLYAGKTELYYEHIFYNENEITNTDATYEEYISKLNRMETYFKYNSIVMVTSKKENKDIVFTGERFVPGIEDKTLELEHIQRYLSIQKIVRGKKVLDAASGEGYGSDLLSQYAESVIGVDLDATAVTNAKEKYSYRENLEFKQGSIANLNMIADNSMDVVVSFETIEHVDENIQNAFLKEIKRILKHEGFLIMSTPNKEIYSDMYNFHNEFHIKEFYKDEFLKFLNTEFKYVKLYNQYFEVTSNIDSVNETEEQIMYYKNKEKYSGDGKYFIAIASNVNMSSDSISSVFMNTSREYEEKINRINQLQIEVEERNKHILKLDRQISTKDDIIIYLQKEIDSKNQHLVKLDNEINVNGKRILQLQEEVEERNLHIKKLDGEIQMQQMKGEELQQIITNNQISNELIDILKKDIEWKNSEINKYQEEIKLFNEERIISADKVSEMKIRINEQHLIEQFQKELEEAKKEYKNLQEIIENSKYCLDELTATREEYLEYKTVMEKNTTDLEQHIRNKEGHIELLLESDRELERIYSSRTWQILIKCAKIVRFFLPVGSKRRLFAKIVVKLVRHPIQSLRMLRPRKIRNFFYYLKKDGEAFVSARIDDSIKGVEIPETDVLINKVDINSKSVFDDYEKLTFTRNKNPIVSIIIPVYNQFEYTYNCLKSILENSGDINYEVIIANDCSTDLTSRLGEVVANIKIINNKTNLRFLKNCNNAAKEAEGKYILFLNNDTQVQKEWLKPLVELIESRADIGMVGSKLVYGDGRLQEAGGILWKDGSAWNYGNCQGADNPEFNYVREVDYISGAAIMIKAELWYKIGGFDERFTPAYCEDSDLAFEVRRQGFKVMYQPLSVVVHFEGVSNGTDINSGQKAYQVINQKKFIEKWGDELARDNFPNGENVFLARDRSRNKPLLLMVDHYVPQYDKDAGSRTVFQYLKLFVEQGFNVKFVGDNFYKHEPYTTVLQQMGIEVLYGPYFANNWKKWVKENGKYIKFTFLNRPHISVKYIDYIRNNTSSKIIYYGHDLHFLREMRKYELTHEKKALLDSKEWRGKELSLMYKADIVYYPSEIEVEEIRKIDANINAKAIVAYIFGDIEEKEYIIKNRKDIMFVGGFTHTPNIDAILWMVKEVLPSVLEKIPDLKFYVMGSNPPQEILDLASKNVIIKGFVSDEELVESYNRCRMSIVPLRYGAGIKGKVVEAMRYGSPVVTTSIGAEGIAGAENILCISDEAYDLAKKISELYDDEVKLVEMSKASYSYIKDNFSPTSVLKVIEKDFEMGD